MLADVSAGSMSTQLQGLHQVAKVWPMHPNDLACRKPRQEGRACICVTQYVCEQSFACVLCRATCQQSLACVWAWQVMGDMQSPVMKQEFTLVQQGATGRYDDAAWALRQRMHNSLQRHQSAVLGRHRGGCVPGRRSRELAQQASPCAWEVKPASGHAACVRC